MKQRVLILGGSGMLGSMVVDYLARDVDLDITATTRSRKISAMCAEKHTKVRWQEFEASSLAERPDLFQQCEWVINCIGIIKPLIHDDDASEVERALRINALFPHLLASWTMNRARVLQIATDCVYSGSKGHYVESAAHDALDVYGKTKSIGEVYAPHVNHLRCSIVGPELKEPRSLMEWFLGQPRGASVNGFVNHNWNGVTTLHFAKLCGGIIKEDIELPHLHHVVPEGHVTKYEMLKHFARCYGRDDVTISQTKATTIIDRTLATENHALNLRLWNAAGYLEAPTVPEMIAELASGSGVAHQLSVSR